MDAVCINYCLCIFVSLVLCNVVPVLLILISVAGSAPLFATQLGVTPESMFFALLCFISIALLFTCSKWNREDAAPAFRDYDAVDGGSESEGEPPLSGASDSEDDEVVYEDSDELSSSSAVREKGD